MPAKTLAEALAAAGVEDKEPEPERKPIEAISIICSKGTLDMAYPGLILANAARMSGIDATLFFTFWGLDIVPGVESLTTAMMKKEMEKLEIPDVREMLEMLHDAGAKLYGCRLAMDMFGLEKEDLVPEVDGRYSERLLRRRLQLSIGAQERL